MSKNDKQIRELQEKIAKKREDLGTRPVVAWRTNRILTLPMGKVNLNIMRTQNAVANVAASIGSIVLAFEKGCELLGTRVEDMPAFSLEDGTLIEDAVHDLKMQLKIVQYKEQEDQLNALERTLKELLSDDAKTADMLGDISKMLD